MTTHENIKSFEEQPKEIERKWLIESLPEGLNLGDYKSTEIAQGYMISTPKCTERVRRKGDKFYFTHKEPTTHAAQKIEIEHEISEAEFDEEWAKTEGKRVEKTRYEIPFNGFTIELDVFHGDNEGHLLAEVEFESLEVSDAFIAPEWFGPDMTKRPEFSNALIAEHGFPVR